VAAGVARTRCPDDFGRPRNRPIRSAYRQIYAAKRRRDERIFAIGDCCYNAPEGERGPVPPRAQPRNQMAWTTYRNIRRLIGGEPPVSFVYRDHGSLCPSADFRRRQSDGKPGSEGAWRSKGVCARGLFVVYRLHLLAIHGWIKGFSTYTAWSCESGRPAEVEAH